MRAAQVLSAIIADHGLGRPTASAHPAKRTGGSEEAAALGSIRTARILD